MLLQPVQLALQAEVRDPADLPRDLHHLAARSSSMLMNHSSTSRKIELGAAAPAVGIAVGVLLRAIEKPLVAQLLEDRVARRVVVDVLPGQPVEAVDVDAARRRSAR